MNGFGYDSASQFFGESAFDSNGFDMNGFSNTEDSGFGFDSASNMYGESFSNYSSDDFGSSFGESAFDEMGFSTDDMFVEGTYKSNYDNQPAAMAMKRSSDGSVEAMRTGRPSDLVYYGREKQLNDIKKKTVPTMKEREAKSKELWDDSNNALAAGHTGKSSGLALDYGKNEDEIAKAKKNHQSYKNAPLYNERKGISRILGKQKKTKLGSDWAENKN
jgi:hypothetical protein